MTDTARTARPKLQLKTETDSPTGEFRPAPKPREARARRMLLETREFKMPDGRPVTINRFAVSFCCPAKDEPETKTVVGVKGAASAMPLAIPYDEFKAWWQQK